MVPNLETERDANVLLQIANERMFLAALRFNEIILTPIQQQIWLKFMAQEIFPYPKIQFETWNARILQIVWLSAKISPTTTEQETVFALEELTSQIGRNCDTVQERINHIINDVGEQDPEENAFMID
ncbi:hypothetical protein M413DRAFT_12559 [Hebeloma cylindrosporum]|uniref:Uncharacterized protein n=1 Tax=Hebeloma cylindrosporum TaxID=76867 RepID=A0A0C2XML9_HEBCY|nr:hypothetical protein M413DRAFT_12559 [Hebeloma cylindrosporum h7]